MTTADIQATENQSYLPSTQMADASVAVIPLPNHDAYVLAAYGITLLVFIWLFINRWQRLRQIQRQIMQFHSAMPNLTDASAQSIDDATKQDDQPQSNGFQS